MSVGNVKMRTLTSSLRRFGGLPLSIGGRAAEFAALISRGGMRAFNRTAIAMILRRTSFAIPTLVASLLGLTCGCAGDASSQDAVAEPAALTDSSGIQAELRMTSSWPTGYCADLVVSNLNPTLSVTTWRVELNLGTATLANSWNGTFSGRTGTVSVSPLDWNARVAPNGSVSSGFCANRPGADVVPSVLSVSSDLPTPGGTGGASGSGGTAGSGGASGGTGGASGGTGGASGGTGGTGGSGGSVLHRRAIAVIADFADRRLEDHSGEGIRTLDDLDVRLTDMEDHWSWLSRGKEDIQWDVERVHLDRSFSADAYANWWDYRNAVIRALRPQVNVADYDLDRDGDIDNVWIISSIGDANDLNYAIGGASFNEGAHVFVDGQASRSVVLNAYGNFNHELGHTLGLPDLYGPFSTVNDLTLMANSWPTPAKDFTAWERMKLGWLEPTVITTSTNGVFLPNAQERFAAVKIPTTRPSEYFMIEYRVRPNSGYASNAPQHDGLAVYHVLEGSNQQQNPPLLKLEPADGQITPDRGLDAADLLTPGNPAGAFSVRSYFGGDEVFRVSNVRRENGGMRFDISVLPAPAPHNLLSNGSFESGLTSWQGSAFIPSAATFTAVSGTTHAGQRSASIASSSANDALISQSVSGLIVGKTYALCGYVKGENIQPFDGAERGASIGIAETYNYSEAFMGTFDWKQACVTFKAETSSAAASCRLGFWGSIVSGRMWCDELSLELLNPAF
jgi:M6 family metalloprotease-like protein